MKEGWSRLSWGSSGNQPCHPMGAGQGHDGRRVAGASPVPGPANSETCSGERCRASPFSPEDGPGSLTSFKPHIGLGRGGDQILGSSQLCLLASPRSRTRFSPCVWGGWAGCSVSTGPWAMTQSGSLSKAQKTNYRAPAHAKCP